MAHSSTPSLTQKWLSQNVVPYQNSQLVFSHIDGLLSRFPSLRPKSDVYTFDDGRTQLLLCIHGLLPITFRQASYNIPIAVWLTRDYPRVPPIAYVVPTNDMLVKSGRYVDVSGRCSIEYIHQWEKKHEGCSLIALIEAMQQHFSNEPPVYSKPKNTQQVPSNSPSDHASPPIRQITSPPTLPPKPSSSSVSSVQPPLLQPHPHQAHIPHNLATPPPLPPHPSINQQLPFRPDTFSSPPSTQIVSPARSYPHFSTPPRPPNQEYVLNPIVSPPPPPPPLQVVSTPAPPVTRAPIPDLLDEDDQAIQPAYIHPNPAAPPRPPNPELLHLYDKVRHKLASELGSLTQALAVDADRLRAHQTDLLAGEPAIRDEMARLEAVRDVCRSVASRTRQAVQQAESNVSELRRKGDPQVDELVCATTIVHNQLVNLVADDNAIEDTIYHLHRALNAGRIDLERFLRSTRVLAEEQFMKRALIDKIRASVPMGVSMESGWA